MTRPIRALEGLRVLSLALNLPGPAALMRCRAMGATCVKIEPPSGDPMGHYNQPAYAQLHEGVKVLTADLKTEEGQQVLHRELARTDVLLTSFRPSALAKLGLEWKELHTPLSVACRRWRSSGRPARAPKSPATTSPIWPTTASSPGSNCPPRSTPTWAAPSWPAKRCCRRRCCAPSAMRARASRTRAACCSRWRCRMRPAYLALPRQWGLTQPTGSVGGAHAGYRVYPCKDGRVAVAALEPHFAAALCAAAGAPAPDMRAMFAPATHAAVAAFLLTQTREQLDRLAVDKDIPLHTMAAG